MRLECFWYLCGLEKQNQNGKKRKQGKKRIKADGKQ